MEQKEHTEMSKDPLEHSEAQGDQRRQTVQFEDTLRVGTLDSLPVVQSFQNFAVRWSGNTGTFLVKSLSNNRSETFKSKTISHGSINTGVIFIWKM